MRLAGWIGQSVRRMGGSLPAFFSTFGPPGERKILVSGGTYLWRCAFAVREVTRLSTAKPAFAQLAGAVVFFVCGALIAGARRS